MIACSKRIGAWGSCGGCWLNTAADSLYEKPALFLRVKLHSFVKELHPCFLWFS